ncbi:MAG: hypothetical protein ABIE84_00965 [bacterium]
MRSALSDFVRPIGYLTDHHGRQKVADRFFALCRDLQVKTAILGGDITPKFTALLLRDGTIIPHLRHRSYEGNTVEEELLALRDSPPELDGAYLYRVTDPEIDFSSMFREQEFLGRLSMALKNTDASFCLEGLFSNDELEFVARQIVPLAVAVEESRGVLFNCAGMVRRIREKAQYSVSDKRDDELSFSFNLLKGVTSIEATRKLSAVGNTQEALACLAAREIIASYPVSFIERMFDLSSYSKLREAAESLDQMAIGQRDYLEQQLWPQVRQVAQDGIRVIAQFGNDDMPVNEALLVTADQAGLLQYPHLSSRDLGDGFWISGYSFVNPIPGIVHSIWQKAEEEIWTDLEQLFSLSDPRRTVYLFHAPPFNTSLDQNFGGRHIGSSAVREAISQFQPYVVLTGHAHGSRVASGSFYQRIEQTHAFNPGGFHDAKHGGVDALIFDLFEPAKHWHAVSQQ